MNRSAILFGLIALVAFSVGIGTGLWRTRPPVVESAVAYPTPRELPPVELNDHAGARLTPERFRGGWDILFFGFTHCPDICPTTLYELGRLRSRLTDLDPARLPRIWLVSVDPERDTPAVLATYLSNYGSAYSGITGDADQIARLAAALGVSYSKVPDGGGYTMAHTAALFLIDRAGKLVALFTAPHDMDVIARDYRELTR